MHINTKYLCLSLNIAFQYISLHFLYQLKSLYRASIKCKCFCLKFIQQGHEPCSPPPLAKQAALAQVKQYTLPCWQQLIRCFISTITRTDCRREQRLTRNSCPTQLWMVTKPQTPNAIRQDYGDQTAALEWESQSLRHGTISSLQTMLRGHQS